MFVMDVSSDSDDSAFLFSNNLPKRKADCDVGNKLKKLRLKCQDGIGSINTIQTEEQIKTTSRLNDTIHADSSVVNNKILKLQSESLSSSEKTDGINDVVEEEFGSKKVEDYFSCPLCLKVFQSETTHFSHMKQCAKKSKMSAKQLLEALHLHKHHLKERISAGLSKIPAKKKQTQVHKGNGNSQYQLALGLALSKSLQDIVGNENEDLTDNINMHQRNRKTLENFGFTSFGRPNTATVKKSKNCKMIHSVLRVRTNEDREKLLTEKAGIILLINDDTIIAEAKESFRMYNCKHVEEIRNKDSHLWKLGESNEETEWYVKDLKDIILEGNREVVEEIQNQVVVNEECNIDEEIMKLNLPKTTILEGWRRLINNKHLSDLTLETKDNKIIYLHSVVLYARYLKIFDSDLTRIFHEFHSSTVLKFLQYLYCGTLDGLVRGEVENLLRLARSLEYKELSEVLNCLMQSLSDSPSKNGNENDSDCSHSGDNHWRKGVTSSDSCEWENTNSSSLEERPSWSVLSCGKYQILPNNDECIEELHLERKEESVLKEDKVESHEESPTKPENSECLLTSEAIQNEETHENLSPGKCKKWNTEEDQLEMDMFEEAENLNKSVNENVKTYSNLIPENEPDCIEISSDSVKSDGTLTECRENIEENDKILSAMDYEIPYFDPYEHFNSDIPDVEPFADSEEPIHSQSLIVGEISPVKSVSPKRLNPSFSYNSPPSVTPPGCCSTPNYQLPQPSTSAQPDLISSEPTERPTKRKRYATPCSKIKRKSGRLSKFFRSQIKKSQKKYRERKSKIHSDEKESETVACALTESILREFDKSIGSAAKKTSPREEQNYIEVTPAVPGEEYVEDISPLPDYSAMGASSIKKHLTKYGLKKSLSRNKAKKILRHIYEELHPILNTKNGKIVKYIESDKPKKCRGKKETARDRKGKRKNTTKRTSTPTGKEKSGVNLQWSQPETPTKKKSSCSSSGPRLKSPKTTAEEDEQSCTNTDSWDGASPCSTLSDGSCFEVEEPLSQSNYTGSTDAPTAVYDFIHNSPDIHRQILMYEPIWLEELQTKLFEKYNKKFKLTDLMDCLDAECVTFRCKSQRRVNSQRK